MATIVSSHTEPLPIPMGGPVLRPGVPAVVERWEVIKDHDNVKAWLSAGVLSVVDEKVAHHPLDHDGNGAAGGSLPADARGLDELRREAEMIGIDVDKRWGEERLRQEIAKAQEA